MHILKMLKIKTCLGFMSESREYSKRERKRRGVDLSAIEKLKQARSGQAKAIDNIKDEEAVYDYVTEDQYADIVNARLQDEWVVGDIKGSGYDDTGREIFDEEQEDWADSVSSASGSKKRKKPSHVKAPANGGIAQFLTKGKNKPQAETKTLGTDALLDELLTSLDKPIITAAVSEPPKASRTIKQNSSSSQSFSHSSKPTIKPAPTRILQKKTLANNIPKSNKEEVSIPFKEDPDPVPNVDEDSMDIPMDEIDEAMLQQADLIVKKEVQEVAAKNVEVKKEPIEQKPPADWSMPMFVDEPKSSVDVAFDKGTCPMVTVDEQEMFKMYYFDLYENSYNNPGTVYLFGKVEVSEGKYTSACVTVKNIPRTIFILPRDTHSDTGEEVKMLDVYKEFNDIVAPKFKISKFQSKPSSKKFAWNVRGLDVPYESEYLEVRYSSEFGALPFNLEGKTFSRIFGTTQTAQELLILQNKLKGPSWILAKNCATPRLQSTWATYEVCIEKMSDLLQWKEELPPPPLSCVSLSLRTMINPKTNANEIISIGALVQSQFHIDKASPSQHYSHHLAAITLPNNQVYPYDFESAVKSTSTNIEVFKSERSMLGWFIARLQKLDPDVIIGYDSTFDIDVLLHRLVAVKVPHWSRISRFKRTTLPKSFGSSGLVGVGVLAGRLVADTKISCKELIRLRKYDLTEFAKIILHETREEFTPDQTSSMFDTSKNLLHAIHHNLNDASFNLKIMFELMALPLSHQITKLCGNIWQRTLLGGRAERNEYLLLHAFNDQEFIVPDKKSSKMKAAEEGEGSKKKDTYSGGLVLEPKKGFYDTYILLLDFNSLYPSIIQEYNVCFTTVDASSVNSDGIAEVPSTDLEPGILPIEIRKLVERRKDVKSLLKKETPGSDKYLQYDIRQKALKLTANSMYGCLGFSNSRFYAKALAALVTSKGREALLAAKNLVESSMRLEVVYGDTDSIMINTHSTEIQEVMQLGRRVKAEVNKMYRLLEIDIDGVFKSMLLLKKKKYAAISLQVQADGNFREERELKGLDIVRRDWSELAKDAGNFVLDCILSNKKRDTVLEEIHSYLTDIGKQVNEGQIPLQKFVIHKSLTKSPSDYPDKKSQPHVQVALRMISEGKRVVSGDVVEYVICEDGTATAPTQRAYHPSELNSQPDTLKIDKHYYLSSQLHPVVSRLCHPIEGTDVALIAECLGLDPAGYKRTLAADENSSTSCVVLKEQDRYKDCAPLTLPCQHCSSTLTITTLCDMTSSPPRPSFSCDSCSKSLGSHYISNKLLLNARSCIQKYYLGSVRCEDTACNYTSRNTPLSSRCTQCYKGNVSYTINEVALFNQLSFYLSLVDFKTFAGKFSKQSPQLDSLMYLENVLETPYRTLKKLLDRNAYSQIDLSKLFSVVGA
ncbi:hypothetical protein ACHWQZ_G002851 [Mnemiopsis leidyi]